MAAKSKKPLYKIENKLLKLDKLELGDIICTICQSILIEPVTLPCYHDFCLHCFNGSVENNALCCPLCRLRIGSWLRTATKQKNLVNVQLWKFIQNKFSKEIEKKLRGEDTHIETPIQRLSEPGSIRTEYEAELKRLREERLRLEEKQFYESELLIRKIHQEEEDANNKYLERLKQDETLAKQIQGENQKQRIKSSDISISNNKNLKDLRTKIRLKPTKIDHFLTKVTSSGRKSYTHNNETLNPNPASVALNKTMNNVSPEMLPNYGRLLKSFLNNKVKPETNMWNKENGETKAGDQSKLGSDETGKDKSIVKTKNGMHSLLVSLPLPSTGIVQSNKMKVTDHRNIETGSVDSMQQELCFFKPIEVTKPTSVNVNKSLPIRVPILRIEPDENSTNKTEQPSREKYLEGLCRLRHFSLSHKLPSAFVIALNLLRASREEQTPTNIVPRPKMKKKSSHSSIPHPPFSKGSKIKHVDGITILDNEPSLRRTRSMGSISKDENEITPKKKIKVTKFHSDKKPYLRSDSKKTNFKRQSCSPLMYEKSINNNKVNLAVKNLSSPLENCDVKNILHEQLRIERIIEQEKSDLELARKMDAEWNGRRQLRRPANKRQVTMNYALRPAKKLKV